jgi:protein ImuB
MALSARRRIRPEALSATEQAPQPQPRATPRELWLAIHLPYYMLESLPDSVPPCAVVDLEHGARVVSACDAEAAEAGIHPGMALNSALALLPSLRPVARDPRRERALLESVAMLALRFSPRVSLDPPDTVLLEVRGSLRLFGGARPLRAELRERLQRMGTQPLLALTPAPLASSWFARMGKEPAFHRREELPGRLAPLPLACTRWPERQVQRLTTMGVRTIGECLRLPRDGFARRLEPRMLAMLDRAVGRWPDPRVAFLPRERFSARRDLEFETMDVARLCHALDPLLAEMGAFLRQRDRGVQALELQLLHREAPRTHVRLRLVEPTAETAHIAVLLRERLQQLPLPQEVRALRVRTAPLVERRSEPKELFTVGNRAAGIGVPQLIERLRARLGADAVQGLGLVPEHRPEAAWRIIEPALPSEERGERHPAGPVPAVRPLWLLSEPQALQGAEAPRYEGILEVEEGPERIESGWWDGRDVARDYYVARNPAGVRLWIFRERRDPYGWFLHGVFG